MGDSRTLPEKPRAIADALAEIADPRALLRGLFDGSPVPYIIFGADGHPLITNQAYRDMFGREPPPEYDVLRDEVAARQGLADAVRRAFAGEAVQTPAVWYDPKELEHVVVDDAKRVAIACSFFPLLGGDGAVTHVAVAFKDVTAEFQARERAEAERDRLQVIADEKERLAAALRESEERLRHTLQAAEVGTWEWDVVHNQVAWSPNIERIFGLAPGTFAGTYDAWLALVDPRDREMMQQRVTAALESRGPYEAEFRFVRPDGTTGWQSTRGYVIADEQGRARLFRGIVMDVTARRLGDDALKVRARVLDSMTEGVSLSDENGVILYTNPAEDRMFGYAPGELIGQHVTVQNAYAPDENARIVDSVIAELRAKGEWAGEWANRKKDGTPFTTRSRITALHVDGRPHWVCVQEDITDEVAARQRADELARSLRASERQMRLVTDALPALVAYIDADGRYRFTNQAYQTWFGVAPASLVGKRQVDLIGPAHYATAREHVRRALGGERVQFETERTLHDGRSVHVTATYIPDRDEDGRTRGFVALVSDITAQVAAREQAEAASRAKDEFLAMLGHELRNPLSPILTALELMKLRDAAVFPRERATIERQVRHVVRLVDDLLDVSRMARGKVSLERRRVELADVMAAAIEVASPLLERRAQRLSVDVARGLVVDGDPTRLGQVFANLLTNAAKYTPEGGAIAVTAARAGGDVVRVSVRDTGIGIRPEILPRIFEMFVQERQASDRADGGLGLGLAIVHSLVALHGGQVEAHSAGPGKGSEFVVRLPLRDAAAQPGAARAAARPAAPRGGWRVLVVDDNEDAAAMLGEALAAWGHTVEVAHDGPSALAAVGRFAPDVALLDIGLPVMDGYELARRLRAHGDGHVPRLIAVTGYGQTRDRDAAAQAGFDAHLVKPVELGAVAAELARVMATTPRAAT